MKTKAIFFSALLGILGSAFAQTLPDGFTNQTLATGFDQPVGMAFLPDGRVILVEQRSARIKVFAGGSVGTLGTIPGVNTAGNERGLLGVAADPGWPARPYLYFYYNHSSPQNVRLVMYGVTGDLVGPASTNLKLGAPYFILTDIPDLASNHNGGTCRFGLDGMLYVSIGDDASSCSAQDVSDLRGVILRIDVSRLPQAGSGPPPKSLITPKGNPFSGPNDNARLTWAFGLRNPFRFNVDPVTGSLYIADVGLRTYEELNESVQGGENFGWPWYEGPGRFSSCSGGLPAVTFPIGGYNRVGMNPASIVSFTRYRNRLGGSAGFGNGYEGDAFYVEYYGGFVRRLKKTGTAWSIAPPVSGQPNTQDWATGIRFVGDALVGSDGALYYLTQFPGALHRIVFTPVLPKILAAGTAPVGKPFLLRCERKKGDRILLAFGLVTIPPVPLPGFFGSVEILGYPLVSGIADSNGHLDVILPVPPEALGLVVHFQCAAAAGVDVFISVVKTVRVVQ